MRRIGFWAVLSWIFLLLLSGCGGAKTVSPVTPAGPPPSEASANPAPAITAIVPGSLAAGSPAQSVTVNGSGFISSTTVYLNGLALATTPVSSTSVTAMVPAAAIAADGSVELRASNPAPGGGTSPIATYSITVPTPGIATLSPQSVLQGAAVTITVSGTGFEVNSAVQWNGQPRPTTYVSASTLQCALTSADVTGFGSGQISVANPGLAPAQPIPLLVRPPTPAITSIAPNSLTVISGSALPKQVVISGSGFASDAIVQANGQPATTVSQTDASITISLAGTYFIAPGSIQLVVSNPGDPTLSSNTAVLVVSPPIAAAFILAPDAAPAGSPDTSITLSGSGFFPDSKVLWNTTPLSTTYVGPSSVKATIPSSLMAGFVQASIHVSTPELSNQPTPQTFDTYLALPVNDIVYNARDGLIYASIPGSAGPNLGNSIAAIDPATGIVRKTIFVGSEPNRIALSSDGSQLFAGLDGGGAVRQVNLIAGTAGLQFSLGGSPPNTALSLAALPGEPGSVAVYVSNGLVTIFDSGVARRMASSALGPQILLPSAGAITFDGTADTLYVSFGGYLGYIYKLTVGEDGILSSPLIAYGGDGLGLQYDHGKLYLSSGTVLDGNSGATLGNFAVSVNASTPRVVAAGPVVSDSTLNRAWILPSTPALQNALVSFDEGTYASINRLAITGIDKTPRADLIRWGQDGLAFHTADQLYVVRGPIVKDTSSTAADLAITLQAPATANPGNGFTYMIQVKDLGPNSSEGANVVATLPQSLTIRSINSTQGSCNGSGEVYCGLGSIAAGSSATIAISVTPTAPGTVDAAARVSSASFDPNAANDQTSAGTNVGSQAESAVPAVTQLSPVLIKAGSGTFTLTVNGSGFSSASTILWDDHALPTTLINSGQVTGTVDASLIPQLGWAMVSVSSAPPGGGQSAALPISIYQLLNLPANAMAYDPFTRKLYAVLPSTSPTVTGNSVVAIDPETDAIGTPVPIGSEPTLVAETSDGNYLFAALYGTSSLARFNLLTQALDLTIPIPVDGTGAPENTQATALATMPGSDTVVAVQVDPYAGIRIMDISGNTGKFRSSYGIESFGFNPVFADATHMYVYNASETGEATFDRYTIDGSGAELIDRTALDGMGYTGQVVLDGGLIYGAGGGLVNPSTTPPSQVAVFPLVPGSTGRTPYTAVPYAVESKAFEVDTNVGATSAYVERFDTRQFTLEEQILLPVLLKSNITPNIRGMRWGQDGLAYIVPTDGSDPLNAGPPGIFLMRGPFVLPSELSTNQAPTLANTDHSTIGAGSGNLYVTVTGTNFLPGATVLWNGSARTTTYMDSAHLCVAIPAADLQTAVTVSLTSKNPGSGISNAIVIRVQ